MPPDLMQVRPLVRYEQALPRDGGHCALPHRPTGLPGIQGYTEAMIDHQTCENRAGITIFEGMSGPDPPGNAHALPLHLDVSVVRAGFIAQGL